MVATIPENHSAIHLLLVDQNDATHQGYPRDRHTSFRQVDHRFCES